MNGTLLNAFRLEEVERLDAMKVHAIAQLYIEHVVFSNEVVG
jgi:hypothetical protein